MAQYQSQFVPTDFNTYGNILQMFRQDMAQRNQEFDQGVNLQNAALAELYGTKTYDKDFINQQTDLLKQRIDEAVKNKGMDYGAAASDIMRLVAQERANPIWGLNQRKVEQINALEELKARNPNLMVLDNPYGIDLSKKGLKPEDIKYSVLDPEDYLKSLAIQYKGRDSKRTSLPMKNVNGYDVFQTQIGMSDAEIAKELTQENFNKSLSGLGAYDKISSNPEVLNKLSGLYSNYLQGMNQGVMEREGMSPQQKLSMRLALEEERRSKQDASLPPIHSGTTQLVSSKAFSDVDSIISTLNKPDEDKYKYNAATQYLDRALEKVKVPEKYVKEAGDRNIIKFIDDKINELEANISSSKQEFAKLSGREAAYAPSEYRQEIINKAKQIGKNYSPIELKNLKELKSKIVDTIEADKKVQDSDYMIDFYIVNPADTRKYEALKKTADIMSPNDMVFITGDNIKGEDLTKREKGDGKKDYEDILSGWELTGIGTSLEDGNLFRIRTKSGKEYIAKHKNADVTYSLSSIVDPNMARLGAESQAISFSGNIMKNKYSGQEVSLPFDVTQNSVKTESGATKRMYGIKKPDGKLLTNVEYYGNELLQAKDELTKMGYSMPEIENYLLQSYPLVLERDKSGKLQYKDTPFRTQLVSDITNYANKIKQ